VEPARFRKVIVIGGDVIVFHSSFMKVLALPSELDECLYRDALFFGEREGSLIGNVQ
jgi:hypothetical protein